MTFDYTLSVFITLITIVDPLGLIPVYLPIADRFSPDKRRKLIWKSSFIAFIVTMVFLILGKHLFNYLEIDVNAIYIVGGILLFMIGLDMINARPRRTKSSPEEEEEVKSLEDVSVFPLAIPMLSGPGTIAAVVMFSTKHEGIGNLLVVAAAILVAIFLAAMAMLFSEKLLRVFGRTGLNVIDRVMGILLCTLAVQFVINAVGNLVRDFGQL